MSDHVIDRDVPKKWKACAKFVLVNYAAGHWVLYALCVS